MEYIEVGMIFESTDKRRPPRQIRVESIETWQGDGWEADYAVVSEKRLIEGGWLADMVYGKWGSWKGQKHLLTDHLTPRHNWRRVSIGGLI